MLKLDCYWLIILFIVQILQQHYFFLVLTAVSYEHLKSAWTSVISSYSVSLIGQKKGILRIPDKVFICLFRSIQKIHELWCTANPLHTKRFTFNFMRIISTCAPSEMKCFLFQYVPRLLSCTLNYSLNNVPLTLALSPTLCCGYFTLSVCAIFWKGE